MEQPRMPTPTMTAKRCGRCFVVARSAAMCCSHYDGLSLAGSLVRDSCRRLVIGPTALVTIWSTAG